MFFLNPESDKSAHNTEPGPLWRNDLYSWDCLPFPSLKNSTIADELGVTRPKLREERTFDPKGVLPFGDVLPMDLEELDTSTLARLRDLFDPSCE